MNARNLSSKIIANIFSYVKGNFFNLLNFLENLTTITLLLEVVLGFTITKHVGMKREIVSALSGPHNDEKGGVRTGMRERKSEIATHPSGARNDKEGRGFAMTIKKESSQ